MRSIEPHRHSAVLLAGHMSRLALLAIALVAGCNLYWGGGGGGGGGCPPGVTGVHAAQENLRDPSTGQCKSFATGCESQCGPCNTIDIPVWPQCNGACDNLSESACIANAQCHTAYSDRPAGGGSGSGYSFLACWNISSYVAETCSNLDAETCAGQHACASLLASGSFTSCIPLPAIGGCTTDPGICYGTVTCTDPPPDCPTGTVAGITPQSGPELSYSCWTGYCIPTTKCPD